MNYGFQFCEPFLMPWIPDRQRFEMCKLTLCLFFGQVEVFETVGPALQETSLISFRVLQSQKRCFNFCEGFARIGNLLTDVDRIVESLIGDEADRKQQNGHGGYRHNKLFFEGVHNGIGSPRRRDGIKSTEICPNKSRTETNLNYNIFLASSLETLHSSRLRKHFLSHGCGTGL